MGTWLGRCGSRNGFGSRQRRGRGCCPQAKRGWASRSCRQLQREGISIRYTVIDGADSNVHTDPSIRSCIIVALDLRQTVGPGPRSKVRELVLCGTFDRDDEQIAIA
jgi:hypothetical protein